MIALWIATSGLIGTAGAVDLSYDDALRLAEEANPSIAGAQQDVVQAEGGLFSARGVWDPTLTSTLGRSYRTSEQRDPAFGLYYQTTTTNVFWNAGLAQTLPTGTSWSLNWENSTNDFAIQLDPDNPFQVEDFKAGSSGLTAGLSQELLRGHRMAYNLQSVTAAPPPWTTSCSSAASRTGQSGRSRGSRGTVAGLRPPWGLATASTPQSRWMSTANWAPRTSSSSAASAGRRHCWSRPTGCSAR